MIIHKSLSKDGDIVFCLESRDYRDGRKWFYGEEYKKAPYPINEMCPIMIEKGLIELREEIFAPYEHPNCFDSFEERERKYRKLNDPIWIAKTENGKYFALDRESINKHHYTYISGFDRGYAIIYEPIKKYTRFKWENDNTEQIVKGGWGIIDREGNLLTPSGFVFDEVWSFYDMGQKGTILHSVFANPEGEYFYFRFKDGEYDGENIWLIGNKDELKKYKEERRINRDRYLGEEEEPDIIDDWKSYTSTGEEWENEDW